MRLRTVALVVLFIVAALTAPLAAEAQQTGKVWQIGYLSPAEGHTPIDEVFERSMKDLGYIEGQNIRLERRYAGGRPEQLASAAAELVRLNVDVIVVWSPAGSMAVTRATNTIPVVFLAGGSGMTTVGTSVGRVASLARPGGNLTGITFQGGAERLDSLEPKYLEMLKELVPVLSHVALLRMPADEVVGRANETAQAAARSLGISRLSIIELRSPEDLKGAFARIEKEKPQALVAPPSGLLFVLRRQVIEFAAKSRLPTVYGLREVVPEGGLMALSPSLSDIASRGAFYVDKILKGAKPADLPVEQPTKFEFFINLKTAKALGLTIPKSLLLRADQVIE